MLEKWALELKKEMLESGVSQRLLASKMGISEQFFSGVINGKNKCPKGFTDQAKTALEEIGR